MVTVASLQIKVGADISAAINGMSKAEFAALKVADSFEKAATNSNAAGIVISGVGGRIGQAALGAQRILNGINFNTLTKEGEASFNTIQKIVDATANAGNAANLIGAGFVKAQQVGQTAMTALGAAMPALGIKIAALAGPIGLAIGAVGALIGAFISFKTAQDNTIDRQEELRQKISEEKAELNTYFSVLNSGNLTYEKRGELIDKINKKYDTTLKNLKDETAFVDQTKKAYDGLVESLTNKIKADVLAEQIKSTYIEIDTLEKKLKNVGKDAVSLPFPFNQIQLKSYRNEFENTKTTIASLREEAVNMTKDLALISNNIVITPKKGEKKSIDEIKAAYDALNNTLTGIATKADQGLIKPINVKDLQVDAFSAAIDKLIVLDRTGKAAQDAIDRYKQFFDRSPLEVPIIVTPNVGGFDNPGTGNAAKSAIDKLTKDFEKQQILLKFKLLPDGTSKLDAFLDKYLSKIQAAVAITTQVGNQLLNIANLAGNHQGKLDELDEYYSKEQEYIDNSIAADSVKAQRQKQLEDDVSKKKKAILREQAVAQKANAIFNAITNTATAVTRVLAEAGLAGPALAAVVGALGAIEIGVIAGTPLPALASGALISGPNAVLVGEYPGASSNPELISPVDKVKKYIVEAVESANGGVSELVGILRNDDLYFMMQRAEQRKFRTG